MISAQQKLSQIKAEAIKVTDDELTVSLLATDSDYKISLLEERLVAFLDEKAR